MNRPARPGPVRRRAMIAMFMVLALLGNLVRVLPAHAQEPVAADRDVVVSAWQQGGPQVRAAAEVALLGSDDQIRAFLAEGWTAAQHLDQRDALTAVIADGGPAVRAKAQAALDADAAGDAGAIAVFLETGWQGPSAIDARVSVNQLMAVGGDQVKQAAQAVLDSEDTTVLQEFLESGWQVQWNTDQRLRVNQAIATGGPNVRAAGQQALDAGTAEALEGFLGYGWAVASARDDEVATLEDLLGQAQAAGALAAQETANATAEADRARDSAAAARRSAAEAAQATAAARNNMAEAKAQAKRAANAAQQAAKAAQVAVEAASAANRAARAASTAANRAAQMASRASQKATEAYRWAGEAATDSANAARARQAAEQANAIAQETREFADLVGTTVKAIAAGNDAIKSATEAAQHALAAAAANDEAVRYANEAGAAAQEAVAAAAKARANAERAVRAAQAAGNYLRVAIDAANKAREAAYRAAADAEAAATAALDAAQHAGEAAQAAQRATEYATAATTAAQRALDNASQAGAVFEAARTADAERLAVARDEALENARAANTEYEAQQRLADSDVDQATKRDAETNRLIAVVLDPATERAAAVAAARKVALNLAGGQGAWTKQSALAALGEPDHLVLAYVRTGIANAVAQDNRIAVRNLAVTDNTALATAATTALAGNDQTIATFLRTQSYPGRYSADRLKVNQILAAAKTAGDVVLAQKAQQALDTDTLQALRDFLDTGQYTAAIIGQRVLVNQILASPYSGPEVKAAAQIALDGPAPGLQKFLTTGRYAAAELDYESAAHVAVVAGLLQKISQVAETAAEHALRAQSVAARARDDAAQAAAYAQQAVDSATRAIGYAQQATSYANQAAASANKAAAAAATARQAATRATTSARSAIKSASWAIASHNMAVAAAEKANVAAHAAYKYAIKAGLDADAAGAAAADAYTAYQYTYGVAVAECGDSYTNPAVTDWEQILGDTEGEWYRNCVYNAYGDPEELALRAYTNSAICALYPQDSQYYDNCINSTLDPTFQGMQSLILGLEPFMESVLASAVWMAGTELAACMLQRACAMIVGGLITAGQVGLEVYRLIKGDQSLADTVLNLGKIAAESLVLRGIGEVLKAGFRTLKVAYAAARSGQSAVAVLQASLGEVKKLKALPIALEMRAGDYSTSRDTAFFWTGRSERADGTWIGGPENAAEIAKSYGGTTLEMVMDSRNITSAWDVDNKILVDAWTAVSAAYARGASGVVRVVRGTDIRSDAIWWVEFRTLKDNPNVTKIIAIDPATKNAEVIWERT
ncbi:hypothetical protein HDA40_005544 [Hamadaea flava]|uniref:ALF repeat-containing protein n=1 Tax=Hamadaea flava TaxID=1742688 RepID=A0ABV8LT79_9ACTN|nr:ALF repeat-containing protein [Hamadaea flava]MCP2327037.1 hypothetical protein [Hamadaea flava]